MKIKQFIILTVLVLFTTVIDCKAQKENHSNVLVILNSLSPNYSMGKTYLIPYLDHFGLPYSIIDIAKKKLPKQLSKYELIIVGHKQIELSVESIKPFIIDAVNTGSGLISFDFHFSLQEKYQPVEYKNIKELSFSKLNHYITATHNTLNNIELFGEMLLPKITNQTGEILLQSNEYPLLITFQKGKGRIVTWTSMDWMRTFVLGPLGGLDDCLWRSFVWAAKKPFAFRGLAPIVTLRIDDVAGQGEVYWGESPLYWVKIANQHGLKPYLALFIYNLRNNAIEELRGYLLSGQASAAPHAFGRPPRSEAPGFKGDNLTKYHDANFYKGFYYYPEALELRGHDYDEYIYYDHHHDSPWSDKEAERGLKAVDEWYKKNQLPMSSYFVPHWGEYGSNVIKYIADKWGIEFVDVSFAPNRRFLNSTPWLKAGPFRLYEEPGTCALATELRGKRPIYYADFITLENRKFFVCGTQIREFTDYEWSPDNNVTETVNRGIKILKRELNSMALTVLFTHETDFIYKIKPKNWDLELKGVLEGIADYKPILMSMEDALRYVRATKTSKLLYFSSNSKSIETHFSGETDIPTHFYLFTEDSTGIHSRLVNIPIFKNNISIKEKY